MTENLAGSRPAHATQIAQRNAEPICSEKYILGCGMDLLVDTQQCCADSFWPMTNEALIAVNSDKLAFVELQTVCPDTIKNPEPETRISMFLSWERSYQADSRSKRLAMFWSDHLNQQATERLSDLLVGKFEKIRCLFPNRVW